MTDPGAVALRLLLYLDLMALFGLAAFALYALRGDERRFGRTIALGPWLLGTAALGALLSLGGLFMLAAGMAGVPLLSVDRASVEMILLETNVGSAWLLRMTALVAGFLAIIGLRRKPVAALWVAASTGAVALATLAWGGHGAMDEGVTGWVHLSADIVHLLAAGIWVGALGGLMLLVFRRSSRTDRGHLLLSHRALDGFSLVGSLVVAAIIVSGVVNSWLMIGPANLLKLPDSLYGQLLILKLLLFGAMAVLAAANRFRLVPAFERALVADDHAAALGALRLSLSIETGLALGVLLLVAWLGTLEPTVSAM